MRKLVLGMLLLLLIPVSADAKLFGQGLTITSDLPINQVSQKSNPQFNWTAPTNPNGAVTYWYALDGYSTLTLNQLVATVNDPYTTNKGKQSGTSITLSNVPDGTYYFHVMAEDADGAAFATDVYSNGPYILNTKPVLTKVSPSSGSHTQPNTIKITGTNFMQGATVDLYSTATGTVAVSSVVVNSYGNAITGTVGKGLAPGTYDLTVTNAAPFNKKTTLAQAYTSSNTTPVPMAGITNQQASFSVDTYTVTMSGKSVVLNLDATASSDADTGDVLSYAWTTTQPTGGGAPATFSGSTKAVTVNAAGSYSFGLIVSDGYASAATTVKVLVRSVSANNPPIAKLSATPNQVATNGSVSLSAAQSSDPDGDTPLSYAYAITAYPTGVTNFAPTTTNSPYSNTATYKPAVPGNYTAKVTVTDPYGASSTATVSFLLNTLPTANAGSDQYASLNSTVTLDGYSSSDGDGGVQTLTYTWDVYSQPAGSTLKTPLSSTAYNPTFTPTVLGDYVFKLTVNDGIANSTNTSKVTVHVISGFTVTMQIKSGINLIPFSLTGTGFVNASDFVNALQSKNSGLSVTTMYGWKSTKQRLGTFYIPGVSSTDFALAAGQGYILVTTGNAGSLTMTGQKVNSVSIANGINLISIPPSETGLVNASDFVNNRLPANSVTTMYTWDSGGQKLGTFYIPGVSSTDFPLSIQNNGYILITTSTATYIPQ